MKDATVLVTVEQGEARLRKRAVCTPVRWRIAHSDAFHFLFFTGGLWKGRSDGIVEIERLCGA